MNLVDHYNELYQNAVRKIKSDEYSMDNFIDSPVDKRRGITLLIRPNNPIKKNIQNFLDDLSNNDPNQYYQPDSDIHMTVMSIISCYNDFNLQSICISDYINLIEKSIKSERKIEINFKGITASPSCIMIQGFFHNNTINEIRDNLRTNFKKSALQQSLDLRYSLQTAHLTVVRFKQPLINKGNYLQVMENYRDYNFGTLTTDTINLVYNDWYQRKKFTKELYKFKIK